VCWEGQLCISCEFAIINSRCMDFLRATGSAHDAESSFRGYLGTNLQIGQTAVEEFDGGRRGFGPQTLNWSLTERYCRAPRFI
jgi:hypothetical protein